METTTAPQITKVDEFIPGSLAGTVRVPYATLVEIFGEPNGQTDGYKVDAQWDLEIDGTRLYVYNYKTGKNYLGDEGLPVEEIEVWHLGGIHHATCREVLSRALPGFTVHEGYGAYH